MARFYIASRCVLCVVPSSLYFNLHLESIGTRLCLLYNFTNGSIPNYLHLDSGTAQGLE